MKKLYTLTLFCLLTTIAFAQSSTNPVYLNYDSNLDWATYISTTGSTGNQPSMFFHLPYVGTTGNAVFEWDADDSGTRKAVYRFEASSDRIFEINGWSDGSKSDLWFGDDNNDKFYIADNGRIGIGNNAIDITGTALDQLVVGDGIGSHGIVVYHGANNDGGYAFANPTGNLTGRMLYDSSDDEIKLQYGGTDRLRYGLNDIELLKNTSISGNLTLSGQDIFLGNDATKVSGNNGYFSIFQNRTDWTNSTSHPIFNFDYNTTYSDNIYIASGGNTTLTLQQAVIISESKGFLVGRSGIDSSNWDSGLSRTDFIIDRSGKIGIGTDTPGNKLEVNGTIRSKEVKVEATSWPDYVFEESYDLPSLSEIEAFIKANKHLPEVPSAKEAEANGIQLGEMNMLLLKKIEELTLHTIRQQKEISSQKEASEKQINELLERIEALEKQKN